MKLRAAVGLAAALLASDCAAHELGYDGWTGTTAWPERFAGLPGAYKITCPRATASCLQRAEALCGGRFLVGGWPNRSPRVQALTAWGPAVINTDNPSVIHIRCY